MLAEQPLAAYRGKPEIDDGHTKIANELLDAIIQTDFTKRQQKLILYIMRKTYGWNKPEDDISRSQMMEATRLHNSHITKTIQELLEMNVIIVSNGNHAKRYKINKYYDTWRVTDLVTITKPDNVTNLVIVTKTVTENYQNSNNSLPKQYPQKTTPKDTSKDNNIYMSDFDSFWNLYPKKQVRKKALDCWLKAKPNLQIVLNALQWQIPEWKKSGNKYVPNATTYINQHRWEDEPFITQEPAKPKNSMDISQYDHSDTSRSF